MSKYDCSCKVCGGTVVIDLQAPSESEQVTVFYAAYGTCHDCNTTFQANEVMLESDIRFGEKRRNSSTFKMRRRGRPPKGKQSLNS